MWKLLKALPKTWRHKAYSPLGSNACPDESAESESGPNVGTSELWVYNATADAAATSSANSSDQNHGNNVSDDGSSKSPNMCLYQWWFNKTLHVQTTPYECPVRSFIEAFCVGVSSLLEKKRGLSASCGKLFDHHVKKKHPGLTASLAQIAFSKHSLSVSHSVLPNQHVDVSSKSSLSDASQATSITQSSDKSESIVPPSTNQRSENDERLNQLEEIAAEYTSYILNKNGKQLVKQKSYGQALAMFNSASELGSAEAKYNLGVCYESGIGKTPDINKAIHYFSQAASQGHNGAQYNLAVFHLEGRGVPVNESKGIEYMEKASEGGIKEAHTFLGIHYGQHGEYTKAVQFFQKAADQKDPDGEYYLGLCYEHGMGVEENVKKAIDLYQKASAAGNAEACYILGTYYDEGLRGVHKDRSCALDFYKMAADAGHQLAMERLKWSSQDYDEDDYIVFEDKTTSSSQDNEEDDYIVFEEEAASSSPSTKSSESTLRTTKSSPELRSQYYDVSSSHISKLPNNLPYYDFSVQIKQFIEQWNRDIRVPEKTLNDNKDHSYNNLSQSLTKLSALGNTSLLWDTTTPKSTLVSMR